MFYLIEVYKKGKNRLEAEPTKTLAVTIHQLEGTIARVLQSGDDVAMVSRISEEVFSMFYQEKRMRRALEDGRERV